MLFFKKKIKYALLLAVIIPFSVHGAMQSSSYVIYDSVMHSFDGPVISNISASVSGQSATVAWSTDVAANSFVEYDTEADFSSSKEQGTAIKNYTSHSVLVEGLEANTTYYYRVKSERVNGGLSIGNPSPNSFTTGSDSPVGGEEEPVSGGGGGILIIDKRDKAAPIITQVNVSVSGNSALVTWETDEDATSFVEYGLTVNYGRTFGFWATGTEHSVELSDLRNDSFYHFRAISSDSYGNVGYSEDLTFVIGEGEELAPGEEEPAEEEEEEQGVMQYTVDQALDFLRRLFPEISLNNIGPDPLNTIDDLDELKSFVPAPIMSGEPRVEVGASQATVYWQTDVAASSLVALAPESYYNADAQEPYQQIVGNPEGRNTSHEVTLYNLQPNTLYHYQLRSQAESGPMARSRDYTFQTRGEELTITNIITQVADDQTAIFKWVTNKAATTEIQYAPYRGNILAVDLSKTEIDNTESVIHEARLENLEGGTFYSVELISRDNAGNAARETLDRFSTSEDDNPPEISHIKADSTVFLDRSSKTQTIISWLTNEPSTSRVYYQEGVHGSTAELKESTDLKENYTKEHVIVITKFKSGMVYSFRVESMDSGGNIVLSKPHTFMTAKKKESIIQIIMNILENTFGWMKDII